MFSYSLGPLKYNIENVIYEFILAWAVFTVNGGLFGHSSHFSMFFPVFYIIIFIFLFYSDFYRNFFYMIADNSRKTFFIYYKENGYLQIQQHMHTINPVNKVMTYTRGKCGKCRVINVYKILDFFESLWYYSHCLSKQYLGEFPSGQRGQTVNLLLIASVVRIHLRPLGCVWKFILACQ